MPLACSATGTAWLGYRHMCMREIMSRCNLIMPGHVWSRRLVGMAIARPAHGLGTQEVLDLQREVGQLFQEGMALSFTTAELLLSVVILCTGRGEIGMDTNTM